MPDKPSSAWILYAVLGAMFAAVVEVTSKPALKALGEPAVNFLRAAVMVLFFAGLIAFRVAREGMPKVDVAGHWGSVALTLTAGLAASLSWFFGYKAINLSDISKAYPVSHVSVIFAVVLAFVFLGDRPTWTNWAGVALVVAGSVLVTIRPGGG